ncbi:MAG: tellurite resistance TerB family protein [Rhodospirillales bacterium]
MLKKLSALFASGAADAAPDKSEARLSAAAAALLVEAAVADGEFDAAERETIERLLGGRFGLTEAETAELIAAAEREVEHAAQLFGFTRVIAQSLENHERSQVLEMLWAVILADGRVDDYEAALARRVAGLLHVSDRDHAAARMRAKKQAQS